MFVCQLSCGCFSKLTDVARYLHQNVIFKMENLDTLVNLDTLNLSQNQIKRVRFFRTRIRVTERSLFSSSLGRGYLSFDRAEEPAAGAQPIAGIERH
jgi:hypothetical protein